jgi:hypothetical protein
MPVQITGAGPGGKEVTNLVQGAAAMDRWFPDRIETLCKKLDIPKAVSKLLKSSQGPTDILIGVDNMYKGHRA